MTIRPDGFLDGRIETLYVSEEYKIFMLTGQTNGGRRNAYVSVRPFNSLSAEQVADLKTKAQVPDKNSRLTISNDQSSLKIYDGFTGTSSSFPLAELDADIKARLQYKAPAKTGFGSAWEKYTGPSVQTASAVTIGKPLKIQDGKFNL